MYFPDEDFLRAELGNRPSQIWGGICEGRDEARFNSEDWYGERH
jgi:hypothetical protein